MPLPADPSGGGGSRGYPANPTGNPFLPPTGAINAGSPFASANVLSGGDGNATSNPFPFFNTDTSNGVPSPLSAAGQQQYLAQANGLNNAVGGTYGGSTDPYQALQDQLAALNSGGTPGDLSALAQQEAGLRYDPLIAQLQNNLSSAKTNTANASSKIGDLYGALGRGLAAQLPGITQQFAAQEQQAKNNYATLQSQIANNYQGAQNAQAAELQKLGIQAALPQSTQRLAADQQYLTNQAGVNGAALQGTMQQMGQGQQDFAQRASMIAPMQGANLQANLQQQLLALQNQINQQIAGYKGQEGAAASTLLGQLQNQYASNQQKQESQLINDSLRMAQFNKLVHPGIYGVAPKAPSGTYKGLTGIEQYFTDNAQSGDPNQLTQDFMSFESSPAMQQLTGPGGSGQPTFETAIPALQQYIAQIDPNIDANGMAELVNALAIKYGKY